MSPNPSGAQVDVVIVGGGVLGVTISYWLSQLYDCSVLIIDRAGSVAFHTSSRNTGVIHRPFYLDPETRKVFAASAELSYPLWRSLATKYGLPWNQVGTIEVATDEGQLSTLQRYAAWGSENGMARDELEVLTGQEVRSIEPEVSCLGAIHSKTDTSVDFGSFTKCIFGIASGKGVAFLGGSEVVSIAPEGDGLEVTCRSKGGLRGVRCRFLVNAAGGVAVDIAHMAGVGRGLTDLHFRGDYWVVGGSFAQKVSRNVYSVARHTQFPFLDPHFVIRADGARQIGPNAALVSGPFTYQGVGRNILAKLVELPIGPKVRLFSDPTFLSLVWAEWRSSISKEAMCDRVRRFIPGLNVASLAGRGLSGVRSSVVDRRGFVPEAVQLWSENSFHVLNYNSPGATGAPVYSAFAVKRLRESGALSFLKERQSEDSLWSYMDIDRRLDGLS